MTPFSSVAMVEQLALLKIAFCKAPALSRTSWRWTSVTISTAAGSRSEMIFCPVLGPRLLNSFRMLILFVLEIYVPRYLAGSRGDRNALAGFVSNSWFAANGCSGGGSDLL